MKKHSPRSQGQPEPSSVSEQETPAIIPPKPLGKGLLRAFTSLGQRNYRLFWFGQMISLIGSYMQTIGQAWLVLELTHSAWQLGLVGALQSLPVLLFSLFGGVFADRWPQRRGLERLALSDDARCGSWNGGHHHCRKLRHHALSAQCTQLSRGTGGPGADQESRTARPGTSTQKRGRAAEHLAEPARGRGLCLEHACGVVGDPGGWPGVALRLELQRRAPPLRYRRAAWRSNWLRLSLCRVRHWLALLGAVAGLGQPEANDPPRADRHAGLRGVGGGVCGLAHLSPVISAHCERWLCGDRLCSAFHYHAPNGRPGPPARAGHERDSALLRRKCPAGISADGLAVRSLWGFHRPAHRCASQPGGRGSRVDMTETSRER